MRLLKKHLLFIAIVTAISSVHGQTAGHMGRWIGVQGHAGLDLLNFGLDLDVEQMFAYSISGGTVELFASKHLSFGFDVTRSNLEFRNRDSGYQYFVEGEYYRFTAEPFDLIVTRMGGHARLYTTRAPAPIGFFMELGLGTTRFKFKQEVVRNLSVTQPSEDTGQLLSITPSNYYSFMSGHFAIGWQWFWNDRFMFTPILSSRFLPTSPRDIRPSSHTTMLIGHVDQNVHAIGQLQLAVKLGYLIY